jgi:type VI secretion system secreted protein Hcp
MDLILLQPGNPDLLQANNSANTFQNGGNLIDTSAWQKDAVLPREQCIELASIHQGMKQQGITDLVNGAHASHRPVITEFTCVKYVDKTSVLFYEFCLQAKPIGKGIDQPTRIYIARNSGDTTANILTIELRDAIISEIQFQSHPDDMPTEQFKLNFTEILWTYHVQKPDASVGSPIRAGWSITHNRSIDKFSDK